MPATTSYKVIIERSTERLRILAYYIFRIVACLEVFGKPLEQVIHNKYSYFMSLMITSLSSHAFWCSK